VSIGAARAPEAPTASQGCLLGLICLPGGGSAPSPTPTPSGGSGGSGSVGGLVGGLLGGGSTGQQQDDAGGIPPLPLVTTPDTSGTVFTLPAAQLGGSSISFGSIPIVSLVTVPLEDGSTTAVIRIQASSVTIDDFVLDVRKTADGDRGVTTSDRMVLGGHVSAYIDSATATLPGGLGLTLGANTPLPGDELPRTLLGVHLGLVGVISDRMTMTPSHLHVTSPGR
jgi:hypothetical protein